jgi:hypothetical protein
MTDEEIFVDLVEEIERLVSIAEHVPRLNEKLVEVAEENSNLREALEKIATCDSRAPGDVVSIAHAALEAAPRAEAGS